MINPKVSIILPTYNGAKYLRKSIESCLAQTFKDFELIIVDDCSKDETPQIIQEYVQKDPRVRYIRNQTNQRLPRSLNIGFAQANGEFLTWTSDDNYYLPEALERMANSLEQQKADFVYCDLYVFYNDDIKSARLERLSDSGEIQNSNCIRACFMYTRKVFEAIGDYDPDMELLEDYDYWVRIYKKFPMLHLAEPLYYYRHHPNSLWTSRNSEIRMAELLFRLKHDFADVRETVWRLSNHFISKRGGWKLLLKVKIRLFVKGNIRDIVERFHSQGINFSQARRELNSIINLNGNDVNNVKHFLFLRRLPAGKGWGGLEKLAMEWFARIDYKHCRVSIAVNQGCQSNYAERLPQSNLPVNLVEYSFPVEGDWWKKFIGTMKFLRQVKPSTVVFLQGAFTDFSLAHTLAGFVATGGRVYMHENLGAPDSPEKFNKRYLGLVPSLELWWHKKVAFKNIRALFTRNILVVSQEIKDRLVDLWHYPKNKVQVTYHGVDTVHYSPSLEIRNKTRKTLGIGENDVVIISTARLSPVKRLERLGEAFDGLHRGFPQTWLLMVGGGTQEQELKKLAQGQASRDRILFFGLQTDVTPYLRASDIFVLPSDNEGLSLALLEAMATGLICVSTNCTGSAEVITDGQNGYIVEKSTAEVLKALRTILAAAPEMRRRMAQTGIEFVRNNFEINSRAKAVLDILEIPHK